jgi:phosphoribosylamine--glycine ligase
MRVLVLGGGAREHALVWRLFSSPGVTALAAAPGNPGMDALVPQRFPVNLGDPQDVVRVAREFRADFVVVGPELPLVTGAVDALEQAGILAFGPTRAAAHLEGSKAFAKEVMNAANVPTARAGFFGDVEAAVREARAMGRVVVKADGLAAGKGVVVAASPDEAEAAVRQLMKTEAGHRILLEELLEGEELSVIALTDGQRFVLLPPAQDHKRVGEGDQGPNTGGMGAYTPVARATPALLEEVGERILAPVLAEMGRRGQPFRGALYAGLMLTAQGPKVIEFNCRMGDPEAQVQLLHLDEPLLPLLLECAKGSLTPHPLKLKAGATVGVVLAAEGYPLQPKLGEVISGLGLDLSPARVFEAGTAQRGADRVTAGGRVLTVCATGSDLASARALAYAGVEKLSFRGCHFRRDIGARSALTASS